MPRVQAAIRATLGNTYGRLGEYAAAEPHLEHALLLRRRELGEEDPRTLNSALNHALMYAKHGRYDEAEPLLLKMLEIQRRVQGKEHQDTLISMDQLASLYDYQGRYDEAEPLYVRTLEIMKRVLGEEHRNTVGSMNNLANVYQNLGRRIAVVTRQSFMGGCLWACRGDTERQRATLCPIKRYVESPTRQTDRTATL